MGGNSGGGGITPMEGLGDAALAVGDYFSGGSLTPYLAATVAGQLVGAYAQNQVLKKQNDAAAAGIIAQGNLQKNAESQVSGTTKTIANETPQATSAAQLASFQKALAQETPNSNAADPSVPGASKAFKAEQGVATGDASKYVNAIAGSAATTEGTQLERVQEGQQLGNQASSLGLLSQQSNEQSYLTKLQIQSQQANPWLTALSTGLKAYGAIGSMGSGVGNVASSLAADAATPATSFDAGGGYTGTFGGAAPTPYAGPSAQQLYGNAFAPTGH